MSTQPVGEEDERGVVYNIPRRIVQTNVKDGAGIGDEVVTRRKATSNVSGILPDDLGPMVVWVCDGVITSYMVAKIHIKATSRE